MPPNFVIEYPAQLPVTQYLTQLKSAFERNQVVIVCGETGSGKTTQLPKMCLELRAQHRGQIGHTQPRRIAAVNTAKRIAEELKTTVGDVVGYQIRFTQKTSAATKIKLMTDGVMLAQIEKDPMLSRYHTIIIDEVHERSLNIDYLLGVIKKLLPRRPDLKIIITSATLDSEKLSAFFSGAPVIEVSGRSFPIEIRYRPPENFADEEGIAHSIGGAIDELFQHAPADTLVFLPGEREIFDTLTYLRGRLPDRIEILPLYARLSQDAQDKIFRSKNELSSHVRIILATNVAETSITLPGIRYVIDSGLARIKRYSYRNKIVQLLIEPIAQSSARQRAGRAGRVSAGVCVRLYSELDFNGRPEFMTPELLRSSLAGVILQMQALSLGHIDDFPLLDKPNSRAISDGYQLLHELEAIDDQQQLTKIGQQLAHLPLDPRLARILLTAHHHHCLTEMLIICSALSVEDIRDRPKEAQAEADHAHLVFQDMQSEFVSLIRVWEWVGKAYEKRTTQKKFAEQMRSQFLSLRRWREWQEVHQQLLGLCTDRNWKVNSQPASYEQIHTALLTGYLGNLGCKLLESTQYMGARQIKFDLWPGSQLKKKAKHWIVVGELRQTTRLYGIMIANIELPWVERVAAHLIKHHWQNPRWDGTRVRCDESASLYGLLIYQGRRVDYQKIDFAKSRQIFIEDALVEQAQHFDLPCLQHNVDIITEIQTLEQKRRRPDVLVDPQLIAAFYAEKLSPEICDLPSLAHWHRHASVEARAKLQLVKEDLMRHQAHGVSAERYPKEWISNQQSLTLNYHFEPGSVRDGVTLTLPLSLLQHIDEAQCQWLVLGMRVEKMQLLLKSLPQKLRRHCIPLTEFAQKFVDHHSSPTGALLPALIAYIRSETTVIVHAHDFKIETLPAHLLMNFKLIDEHGRQLDLSRNLSALQQQYGNAAKSLLTQLLTQHQETQDQQAVQVNPENLAVKIQTSKTAPSHPPTPSSSLSKNWSFGTIAPTQSVNTAHGVIELHLGLQTVENGVILQRFDLASHAQQEHQLAVLHLIKLALHDNYKAQLKNLRDLNTMALQFSNFGSADELRQAIVDSALLRAAVGAGQIRSEKAFTELTAQVKQRFGLIVMEVNRLIGDILQNYTSLKKRITNLKTSPDKVKDMEQQLNTLIHKRFISATPYEILQHFPRYLNAITMRIEKLHKDPERDTRWLNDWQSAARPYQKIDPSKSDLYQDYRWQLEELRVALFAQELRTPQPMSLKRMQKIWMSLEN